MPLTSGSYSDKITWNLLFAGCLRLILLLYGLWQDEVMAVGFTDIDYTVFTDAARYMSQGLSPYKRATYRYTPVLAFLLQGNVFLSASFGKFLFVLCDIQVGYLIYKSIERTNSGGDRAIRCAQFWLFNPLTMVVSTRGNAESVMAAFVVGMLYLLRSGGIKQLLLGAVLYGLSVHFKIYPAVYVLAVYLFINVNYSANGQRSTSWIGCLYPTSHSFLFGLVAAITFIASTTICYIWYGDDFMVNTYLYHITRRDIRHNFSVYFYFLYLTSTVTEGSVLLALSAFVPQLLLVLTITVKFFKDIEFTCFLLTFIFVTFNKVCTSQYFLWYLCLLPLIVSRTTNTDVKEYVILFIFWLIGQVVWLLPAYLLEFQGYNVYIFIWLAGLAFFAINIYIVFRMIMLYRPRKMFANKN